MSRYAALFLLLLPYIYFSEGYKYRLITREDSFDRCRNLKCEDGQPHSICLKANGPSANCAEFEILKMTAKRKNILINGHNGIRNKIAGYFHIANMLLLHWDEDLHEMARGFLTRCTRGKDSCNFIYNDTFTVGQTYYFNPKLPLNRFVITIMRHWFLEANDIETFADFMKQK
ncbi:unnamed protein product [Hermetia illucens]|uniref:Uncharacterized protein n=2 Tax=Hermetia illucens TaxID=343691 RepID=A0A7R8UUY9_HERIL|nr:unnamed protein product [Hermetia illucens]